MTAMLLPIVVGVVLLELVVDAGALLSCLKGRQR
jgi:hypothetical protein